MQLTAQHTQDRKGNKIFAWATLIVLALIFLTIMVIISMAWIFSYEEIAAWKEAYTAFFQYSFEHYDKRFTIEQYKISRYVAVGLWLMGGLLGTAAIRYKNYYFAFFSQLYIFLKDQIRNCVLAYLALNKLEKTAFFSVFAFSGILHIYHLSYLPVQIDELLTYFYFVKKGFLLTSVFYPFPNNHVFFNYTYLFFDTFVDDPILAGRLPSLLSFHLMLLLLFFGLLRYLKDSTVALFSVLVCTLFFPSGIYAAEARGYAILSLCTIIACFALLMRLDRQRNEAFIIFIGASVVGAFTVPIFLVPYLALVSFGTIESFRRKDKPLFRRLIINSLYVGLGVFFCYLPMFLFSGIESITANEFVVPVSRSDFFTFIYPVASAETLSYLATVPSKGWAVFLVFGLLGLMVYGKVSERHKKWIVLSLCFFLVIFVYAIVARRFPYQRTLTYSTYFIYSSFAIIVLYWVRKIGATEYLKYMAYTSLIIVVSVLAYFQYQKNRYEISMLPNEFYRKIELYYTQAVHTQANVYQGVQPSDIHVLLYYRYLSEKHDVASRQVNDYEQADMLFLKLDSLPDKAYDLSNYTLLDTIPSDIYFLAPMVIYEKKDR